MADVLQFLTSMLKRAKRSGAIKEVRLKRMGSVWSHPEELGESEKLGASGAALLLRYPPSTPLSLSSLVWFVLAPVCVCCWGGRIATNTFGANSNRPTPGVHAARPDTRYTQKGGA